MRKFFVWVIGALCIGGGIFFFRFRFKEPALSPEHKPNDTSFISTEGTEKEVSLEAVSLQSFTQEEPKERTPVFSKPYDMPFVSQAPDGNWRDSLYQDGCEEASMLLLVRFLEGKVLTTETMKSDMRILATYLEKRYGTSRDLSLTDSAAVLRDYFDREDAVYRSDVTEKDIQDELRSGNILLVQTNGQALQNPHYTAPGPERHMLIAIGYDGKTGEVITNDPGTKFGKKYRYPLRRFFEAIREYPTGDHLSIPKPVKKSMILFRVSV